MKIPKKLEKAASGAARDDLPVEREEGDPVRVLPNNPQRGEMFDGSGRIFSHCVKS